MPEKMLAAVYRGPRALRLEERHIPEIASDEVLLRVVSTGICGTDLRIFHGAHAKYAPGTIRVPGHEVAGDIVQVGSSVNGFDSGQRVFVAPNIGCGHCRQCVSGNNNLCPEYDALGITLDGSFAEYLRIPAAAIRQGNLIPVPDHIDPAAIALIEPFACVLRGQDALQIQPGESVLVIGAGPIGSMHALLAQVRGAGKVLLSELNARRVRQAKELGIDRVIDPANDDLAAVVAGETDGAGADVVIVAAPAHNAQEAALELAAIRGRINFFGGLPKDHPVIDFNSNLVHYKELTITGTTACSTHDCRRAAAIVNSGKIDLSRLVGARYPLRDVVSAFQAVSRGDSLKVVLEP